MASDWVTLPEAAQRLGISVSTARRWIREGKLEAKKEPGPYGPEYHIQLDQLDTANEIRDVVQVDRPVELVHVATVLERHLSERDGLLSERLDSFREELLRVLATRDGGVDSLSAIVVEGLRRQDEELAALRTELRETREVLARTETTLQAVASAAEIPWWRRMWPWKASSSPLPVDRQGV